MQVTKQDLLSLVSVVGKNNLKKGMKWPIYFDGKMCWCYLRGEIGIIET
jgi:hypothetical protein